jgi:hypothetical protein
LICENASVNIPHDDCRKQAKAIEYVAKDCPVYGVIKNMEGMTFDIGGAEKCDLT